MQSANGASWNGLVAMCPLVRAAHLPPWLRVLRVDEAALLAPSREPRQVCERVQP